MNEAFVATLGSWFFFHGNKETAVAACPELVSGSHSSFEGNSIKQPNHRVTQSYSVHSVKKTPCNSVVKNLHLPCFNLQFFLKYTFEFFKNKLAKTAGVFPAEYISERTSVRRNKSSIRDILLGTKNVFLNFLYNPATIFLLLLLFFCNAETLSQSGSANKLNINFKNMVGNQLLQTDSVYTNPFGETFTVSTFKYYISNIVLSDDATGKKQFYNNQYFLVDEDDSASKKIELTTTLNSITSIQFLLGVDSLKNVSGIQTGNLDPAKGMFWTWNTGYVMAKLEGNSPVAKTPQHAFSYHVGGYKKNEQTARQINLVLPQKLICENATAQLTVQANIPAWFNAMNAIKIAESAFCHAPGLLAVKLADNYSKMFSVVQ